VAECPRSVKLHQEMLCHQQWTVSSVDVMMSADVVVMVIVMMCISR